MKIAPGRNLEASMHEYEIRILRADRTTASVMEVIYLNDRAAIRAARKLAEARLFEVWRDLDCIYGRTADFNPSFPRARPAA
jgi:hypothetical protein